MSKEEELKNIENVILSFNDDISNIKAQMTDYICGNPDNREKSWYALANKAMTIKKQQRQRLIARATELKRELKEEKRKACLDRAQLQNELFYSKLKELMPAEEFRRFIAEVDAYMDE